MVCPSSSVKPWWQDKCCEKASTSLSKFTGSERREIGASECLKKGAFIDSDNGMFGIAAEILDIKTSDNGRIDYVLPIADNKEAADDLLNFEIKDIKLKTINTIDNRICIGSFFFKLMI